MQDKISWPAEASGHLSATGTVCIQLDRPDLRVRKELVSPLLCRFFAIKAISIIITITKKIISSRKNVPRVEAVYGG